MKSHLECQNLPLPTPFRSRRNEIIRVYLAEDTNWFWLFVIHLKCLTGWKWSGIWFHLHRRSPEIFSKCNKKFIAEQHNFSAFLLLPGLTCAFCPDSFLFLPLDADRRCDSGFSRSRKDYQITGKYFANVEEPTGLLTNTNVAQTPPIFWNFESQPGFGVHLLPMCCCSMSMTSQEWESSIQATR